MQKVLSSELWKTVRANARRAQCRKAAIAYVTRDLVGFRKGDTLIVNASTYAVANGETDAKLLRTLYKKGVHVYDCTSLHAKVLLFDNLAIIGSGNMSNWSASGLVEAGVITDHKSTTAGVASIIQQLLPQSRYLQGKHLAQLCQIKVSRRHGLLPGVRKSRKPNISRLGDRTWLVGVRELVKEPPPEEQKKIDLATEVLRAKTGDPDLDPDWIRWFGRSRFRKECRQGDSVIRIWRSRKAKLPSGVFRATPVLLKQDSRKLTRFYLKESTGSYAEMSWGKFKRLMKEMGYPKRVDPSSTVLLDPDVADAIERKWISVTKS